MSGTTLTPEEQARRARVVEAMRIDTLRVAAGHAMHAGDLADRAGEATTRAAERALLALMARSFRVLGFRLSEIAVRAGMPVDRAPLGVDRARLRATTEPGADGAEPPPGAA